MRTTPTHTSGKGHSQEVSGISKNREEDDGGYKASRITGIVTKHALHDMKKPVPLHNTST